MDVIATDDFDLLLNDVLRSVANPEVPARVQVRTRIRVYQMTANPAAKSHGQTAGSTIPASPTRTAAVFAPDLFLAKMQPKRDTRSTLYALLTHAAAILLVCWVVSASMRFTPPTRPDRITELTAPPRIAPALRTAGGGGGSNTHAPAAKGQLPKFAPIQITPPKIPVEAKVPMPAPAIEAVTNIQMANPHMPNLGMPNSTASGASLGEGKGTGIGSGNGPGLGAGRGGNWGGGDIRKVGGGVSEPVLMNHIQPEFSEEARRTKTPGVVTVDLIVDAHGMPQNVHVVHGVGMGLDEKAVEAVKLYRFKPAMENGKPVAVEMYVVVSFQIE
jgi:protein TonB